MLRKDLYMSKINKKRKSKNMKIYIVYFILVVLFLFSFLRSKFVFNIFGHFTENKNVQIVLYISILITFAIIGKIVIHKRNKDNIKNDDDAIIEVISDYLLILEFAFILGSILEFLKINNIEVMTEFIYNLYFIVSSIYLFKSIKDNILDKKYIQIIGYLIMLYFLGRISLNNWALFSVLLGILTFALDYDKYVIMKGYIGSKIEVKESKIKEKLTFIKFKSLITTLLIYIFLLITKNINFTGKLYTRMNDLDSIPNVVSMLFKGLDKFLILVIIYGVYKKIIEKNKENSKKKFIEFIIKYIDDYEI